MDRDASDEALSVYYGQLPLTEVVVQQLKIALTQPNSPELREFIAVAIETGADRLHSDQVDLKRKILARSPHLFCSEAIERATVASSLTGRLYQTPLWDADLGLIWKICSSCKHGYQVFVPGFSAADIDRLLRARTLATEEISATIEFQEVARYLTDAFDLQPAWAEDPRRLQLYRSLIERLELSEAETRQNTARAAEAQRTTENRRGQALAAARKAERFFREDDYAVLEMLRRMVGATGRSGAATAKLERDREIGTRRDALIESISPTWRAVFEWLLDMPVTNDNVTKTLRAEPRLTALTGLNEVERGAILSDLARLRMVYPDWVRGRAASPIERLDGLARRTDRSEIDGVGFHVWKKLGVVASLLVSHPARLVDEEMGSVIAAAQDWRPLCDFGLFASAELTLSVGPAPRTVANLEELAKRPSHAIVPGNAGPDYEGDIWWNVAPMRARDLLARYGQGSRQKGIARFFRRSNVQ